MLNYNCDTGDLNMDIAVKRFDRSILPYPYELRCCEESGGRLSKIRVFINGKQKTVEGFSMHCCPLAAVIIAMIDIHTEMKDRCVEICNSKGDMLRVDAVLQKLFAP